MSGFVPPWLRGQHGNQIRWPADARASLSPPTLSSMANAATPYGAPQPTQQQSGAPMSQPVVFQQSQVFYPMPLLPVHPNIAHTLRDVVLEFSGMTLNQETVTSLQVDIPGVIYAMSAAAYTSNNSALPVGRHSLDTFKFRLERNNGDRLQTRSGIGSAILGPASKPRILGGSGYMFDRSNSIRAGVTPLIANLVVSLTFWILEYRGPTNLNV